MVEPRRLQARARVGVRVLGAGLEEGEGRVEEDGRREDVAGVEELQGGSREQEKHSHQEAQESLQEHLREHLEEHTHTHTHGGEQVLLYFFTLLFVGYFSQ